MSGKRLLDTLAFLQAARSVGGKHVALRRHQIDVRLRTSSLSKEARNQVDRVALAVQAASELARRFEEPTPSSQSSADHIKREHGSKATDKDTNVRAEKLGSDKDGPVSKYEEQGKTEHNTELKGYTVSGSVNDVSDQAGQFPGPRSSSEAPVEASTETRTQAEQGELSEAVMGQLFRSPKAASHLGYRAKMYGSKGINKPITESKLPRTQYGVNIPVESSDMNVKSQEDTGSMAELGSELAADASTATTQVDQEVGTIQPGKPYKMIESRVPSSRLGRLWEYGGLATSMAFGIVGESLRRATTGEAQSGSLVFSPVNMERLVAKLSKMRGAALKLGQMMSFQDSKMLPPAIQEVLQRVQDQANYMPASQRDKVLIDNLGPNWRDLLETFDEIPMAAASIGQVHDAVLKETGQRVAVKIQYPGVANSIDSDLNNLSILLTASRLLPKGLYLDKTIANARTELAWECDYLREADCGRRFKQLLEDETSTFMVPEIISSASGKQVLTMERMDGIAVTRIQTFTQAQRDWIGTQILRLCLREICEFRFMQTDPNWTNFLYNSRTNRLELLDFGASREYPASFISTYLRTLLAASSNDRDACRDLSIKLGYLTGFESPAMVDAHISSILTIAEPFMHSAPDLYDFSDQTITERVRDLIPLMLRERLSPPPEETYSLHRKLSGAFLLCARLGSRVPCKELFANALNKVEWTDEEAVSESESVEKGASAMS